MNAMVEAPLGNRVIEGRLKYFLHYQQPMFVLRDDMQLLETNLHGSHAIEKHWVGLTANKIHFNSRRNDLYVRQLTDQMMQGIHSSHQFVLPCIDSIFRSYTLTRGLGQSDIEGTSELVLTIQNDLVSKQPQIDTVAQAFSLSGSETKVLKLMVDGLRPKEIAYELELSLHTIRSHLRTIYAKMNVHSYSDSLKLTIRLLV